MIGVYELTLFSPAFALVAVAVAAVVSLACHAHRDLARERHRERKNGGIFR